MSFLMGTLSQFWLTVQGTLFPWLAAELGELSGKQKQLVAILELLSIESFINLSRGSAGRPARYQSSVQGRFISVDPLGVSASEDDPQSFNRYSYVNNNPLNFTDPDGMMVDG